MGIEEISTFVEAVEQGSLAGAARALRVPRSTVSRRVTRLEEELGQALIHRHAHLFKLTDAGELLYRRAASSVRTLQDVHRYMVAGGNALGGELRMTMPQDLGGAFGVVRALADFRAAHPDIRLMVDLRDRSVDLAAEGVDVALRAHVGALEDATSIKVRRLGPLHLGLYAAPSYLERFGAPEHPDGLREHACVAPTIAGLDARWELVERDSGARVQVPVRADLRASTMSFLLPAALAGAGIVPVVTLAAARDVEAGALVPVLPRWRFHIGMLSIAWLADDLPSPRRRALLDFLIERLTAELA